MELFMLLMRKLRKSIFIGLYLVIGHSVIMHANVCAVVSQLASAVVGLSLTVKGFESMVTKSDSIGLIGSQIGIQ